MSMIVPFTFNEQLPNVLSGAGSELLCQWDVERSAHSVCGSQVTLTRSGHSPDFLEPVCLERVVLSF